MKSNPSSLCLSAVVLVLLALGTNAAEPVGGVRYAGSGLAMGSPLLGEWFYSFRLQKAGVQFSYVEALPIPPPPAPKPPANTTANNSTAAPKPDPVPKPPPIYGVSATPGGSALPILANLMNGTAVFDYVVINDTVPDSYRNLSSPVNDVFQFPIYAVPIVIAYNLPYGNMMDPSDESNNLQLVLDRTTIAGIFNQQIINWRDPAILALQRPAVAALLPNTTILTIVRDQSPDTLAMQNAARSFNKPQWRWSISDQWDQSFLSGKAPAPGNKGPALAKAEPSTQFSQILTQNNAIAYVPYPYVAGQPIFKLAGMINAQGELLENPDMSSVIEAVGFDPVTLAPNGPMYDVNVSGAWPIGQVHMVSMRLSNYSESGHDCEDRSGLMKFWRWVLTTPSTLERATSLGYTPIPQSVIQPILDTLASTITCPTTGESLLAFTHQSQHDLTGFTVLLAFDLVCMGLTSAMVFVYLFQNANSPYLTASALSYYLSLWAGSVLNFVSVIMFYLVPDRDSVCLGRLWLSALGTAMMLSALFCRAYQVWAIRNLVESKNMLRQVDHCAIQAGGTSLIMLAQLVLLIVWTATDKFSSSIDQFDPINLTQTYICASSNPRLWWGLEIAFVISLLAFGLYVVYQTWDLKHMVKESKWISISIYNSVVVGILLAILLAFSNPSDDWVFWITGGSIFFLTLVIMLAIFLPRALAIAALTDYVTVSGSKGRKQSQSPVPGVGGDSNSNENSQIEHGDKSTFCPCSNDAPHDPSKSRSPRVSMSTKPQVPQVGSGTELASLAISGSTDAGGTPQSSARNMTGSTNVNPQPQAQRELSASHSVATAAFAPPIVENSGETSDSLVALQ